jgi:hypothetical protein
LKHRLFAERKGKSWSTWVVWEYTLSQRVSTSVREEQPRPLESRLIADGICRKLWELIFDAGVETITCSFRTGAGIEMIFCSFRTGASEKDTRLFEKL